MKFRIVEVPAYTLLGGTGMFDVYTNGGVYLGIIVRTCAKRQKYKASPNPKPKDQDFKHGFRSKSKAAKYLYDETLLYKL